MNREIGSFRKVLSQQAIGILWPEEFVAPHQLGMGTRPDMVLEAAHRLAAIWAAKNGIDGVEVRARVCASLNGRPAALLLDPTRNLIEIEESLEPADWILPLRQPFERPAPGKDPRDLSC